MLTITEIPPEPVTWIAISLTFVALLVLILPFKVNRVEHNLELFFLSAGVLSVTISGLWSFDLVIEALKAPVIIGSLPIGIFQVVLVVGLLIFCFNRQFEKGILTLVNKVNMRVFVFFFILLLGILSSVISVILAAVLMAEIVAFLPLSGNDRIKLVVITCYSMGLGAVLTPLGEPLSTILVQKLSVAPFYAGFTWPFFNFAMFVLPGVFLLSIFGAVWIGKKSAYTGKIVKDTETIKSVIIRALKVYIFVAALVLLGEGLKPLIFWFFSQVHAAILFWVNTVSAVLDNATLTAIEINASMSLAQIIAIIMGLLIAGGMLIPGNIPNIIASCKLKIKMKEWARIGLPIGLALLVLYFVVLLPIII